MFLRDLARRQALEISPDAFSRRYHVTGSMVRRLGLQAELEGHQGCVNCIQWNQAGDRLLSGSDDQHIILWDPLRLKTIQTVRTEHTGNIFSVKFLPHSGDGLAASGAADSRVQVHDLNKGGESVHLFSGHHFGRVKRLDVAQDEAHLLWSAGEDGLVMQFDMRCDNRIPHVLVNLNAAMGDQAEAKCVSVNQINTNMMAVGANDEFVRLYDRRSIRAREMPQEYLSFRSSLERHAYLCSEVDHVCRDSADGSDNGNGGDNGSVQYLVAGHLPSYDHLLHSPGSSVTNGHRRHHHHHQPPHRRGLVLGRRGGLRRRPYTATYVCFSPCGKEVLVNMGGEQIYLFSLAEPGRRSLLLPATQLGVKDGEILPPVSSELSSQTAALKERANAEYNAKNYADAIHFYNLALVRRKHPVLLSNRAAATLKRNWDGDPYCALRDCHEALKLDRSYVKAHLRLVQSLVALDLPERAEAYLSWFRSDFAEHADSGFISTLETDIRNKTAKLKEKEEKEKNNFPDDDDGGGGGGPPSAGSGSSINRTVEIPLEDAVDFDRSFCGHCNTTTDIKEASFFGGDGQFVAAGSDDGKFFIWERESTNIVRIFEGDDSIVNCLQGHPTACILASSGIDPQVRLWSPFAEDGKENARVISDHASVSSANQRRMRADPFEALLLNMGMTFEAAAGGGEGGEDDDDRGLQCRPS